MTRKYCANCKQYVEPKKTFHGIAFTLIMIFVWAPLLFIEFMMFVAGSISYTYGFTRTGQGLVLISFLMLIVTFLSPFVYVIYHIFGKTARCPICNDTQLSYSKPAEEEEKE